MPLTIVEHGDTVAASTSASEAEIREAIGAPATEAPPEKEPVQQELPDEPRAPDRPTDGTGEQPETPPADAPAEPRSADAAPQARDDKGRFSKAAARHDTFARLQQQSGQIDDLKQQLAARDAELARLRTVGSLPPVAQPPVVSRPDYPSTRPVLEQFSTAPDPYQAHTLALVRWEMAEEARKEAQKDADARYQMNLARHQARVNARAAEDADYRNRAMGLVNAMTAAGLSGLPDVLVHAIVSSDHSVEILDELGTHPEQALELARDAAASPISSAPIVRRYLESLVTAARPTGSAAPVKQSRSAPPPKPVGSAPNPPDLADEDQSPDWWIDRERKRRRRR